METHGTSALFYHLSERLESIGLTLESVVKMVVIEPTKSESLFTLMRMTHHNLIRTRIDEMPAASI
jgi:hypothetical protein